MSDTVVVTGGAGFIGSHACKALAQAGFSPVTYDNLSRGPREAVLYGPLEVGDIGDVDRLTAVLRDHDPCAVMHFAAYAHVGESVSDPLLYYRNNVSGSVGLLEAMRDAGVTNLVFSSTCAVYGVPQRVPITEGHPQAPINPYGASKQMMERIIADCEPAWGLRAVILRYFNAAGADPDGDLGENHDPEPHLIPNVLDAALGRKDGLTVNGADYPTPDGTCIRDYIHVSDLADAHILALKHLLNDGTSMALNLGNGNGYSVREVMEAAERVTGLPIPWHVGPRRPGDPPSLVGDATQARRILGWTPERSGLDVQIADAWRRRLRELQAPRDIGVAVGEGSPARKTA
ncbi:UDP-glucose 4-epimerase GalE [Nitrospirillum amazonense]|uniref:UDP-glucose 4-epimerase GalE n=1 Tax=Nitrospirillum amazonense TaxID=28077 RepID=UPI0024129279|nr:UDP-glucose 4-epimerase GalE [Nitrospirillum amazonense]MDG3444144.1 UDP-glucose 4-epimerase GalE [Nitrospirillum amazonense]